jgi:hypothetical protein
VLAVRETLELDDRPLVKQELHRDGGRAAEVVGATKAEFSNCCLPAPVFDRRPARVGMHGRVAQCHLELFNSSFTTFATTSRQRGADVEAA